jgi:hypothetical protein
VRLKFKVQGMENGWQPLDAARGRVHKLVDKLDQPTIRTQLK